MSCSVSARIYLLFLSLGRLLAISSAPCTGRTVLSKDETAALWRQA